MKRTISLLIFVYSLALFIGLLGGSTSMSKPLSFVATPSHVQSSSSKKLEWSVVTSISEFDSILEKSVGKKVLLDFTAEWCTSCKELEEVTFKDDRVKAKMGEYILVKADITKNSSQNKALSKKYQVFGPPAILFFNNKAQLQPSKTVIGFIEPKEFLGHL